VIAGSDGAEPAILVTASARAWVVHAHRPINGKLIARIAEADVNTAVRAAQKGIEMTWVGSQSARSERVCGAVTGVVGETRRHQRGGGGDEEGRQ
jgi:hypothetical protein